MKKYFACVLLTLFLFISKTRAQSQEVQQLLLDVTKLEQFKQILKDMKTGYSVVMQGYSTIRDISKGDFDLHKVFLDGLMTVSPAVKKYQKIATIVGFELRIIKEYKAAYNRFGSGGTFNVDQLAYVGNVYNNLLDQSLKNIGDLTTVLTDSQLQMSDEERLSAIDNIYQSMQDKMLFLRSFDNNSAVLALQYAKTKKDVQTMQKIIEN
ncbi:TerB family tellurite resistance protein [Arachidicoccus sp.]|uniref:TerB family tellurite resistance protein n=1 Tax=Arachidicoccus sp. TaxID=1872624 RepID=UPI003D1A9939